MTGNDLPGSVFRIVAEQLDTGILILDEDNAIVYWNRFMTSHSNIAPIDAFGRSIFEVFPGLPAGLLKRKLALVRTLGTPAFTSWRERPEPFPLSHGRTITGGDGRMKQNLSIYSIVGEPGACPYVCIAIYDNSEVSAQEALLQKANTRLLELSRTDLLTGLNNRREMERRLCIAEEDAIRYSVPFTVLLIDIDHFKNVNDTYGHAAGDDALRLMGQLLSSQLRAPDTSARFGGEEFVACLTHVSDEGALDIADRLRVVVENSQVTSGKEVFSFTISIGVATWTPEIVSYDVMLKQADKALYEAKRDGRNRVVRFVVTE